MVKRQQIKKEKTDALTWGIFLATAELVLLSSVSIIFPALITRTASPLQKVLIGPWELGLFSIPLILVNVVLFGITFAYFKNKLPQPITKAIKSIFNFEVSRKVAFITMAVLLTGYILASIDELDDDEGEIWTDFQSVKQITEEWSFDKISKDFTVHLRWFYLKASLELFDNIRVVPFIGSITLLIVTYLFALEITKKRFSALVATVILLQSFTFWEYDTLASYDNFWTLFFILSLYMVLKFWPLTHVFYVFAIFSKALAAVFVPMILFLIYRSNLPRKKKIMATIPFVIIIIAGLTAISVFDINLAGQGAGDYSNLHFWQGFTTMAYQLRFDYLVLFCLLPVTFGLFIAARRKIPNADVMMFFIATTLLSYPLLTGFSEVTNQPYRYILLIIFVGTSIGVILSENKSKHVPSRFQKSIDISDQS